MCIIMNRKQIQMQVYVTAVFPLVDNLIIRGNNCGAVYFYKWNMMGNRFFIMCQQLNCVLFLLLFTV